MQLALGVPVSVIVVKKRPALEIAQEESAHPKNAMTAKERPALEKEVPKHVLILTRIIAAIFLFILFGILAMGVIVVYKGLAWALSL